MTSGVCRLAGSRSNTVVKILAFFGLVLGLASFVANPAQAQDVDYSIGVGSVLNVTVPSSVTLNLSPTVKTFDSQNLPVTVRTNNRWGYKLVMSSVGTSLVNTADSNIVLETLPELEGGYTTNTFIDNKWGYKIGNGNYMAYESGVTLLESSEPTAGDSATLNFAAKINHSQPAGSYNLALNFQVVAGVEPVPPPTMQTITADIINGMQPGDTMTLEDERDHQEYTVAKIGSLLWMTKNLNLAGGTQLTANDTHLDGGCGLTDCTLPASSANFSSESAAVVFNSNSANCSSSSGCYSYYSYAAATAGTNPSSDNATSDICPKGWRLPTKAEYDTLISTYTTGDTLTAAPFLGVYGGYYFGSSFNNGGSRGYYWSSTANDSSYAYRLYFKSSSAAGMTLGYKRYGHGVRCVKDGPTMQTITASMCTSTPLTVPDTRDGQEYTIKRLDDGNCWMMTNLNLGAVTLTQDITTANSNINPSITGGIAKTQFANWNRTVSGNGVSSTTPKFSPVTGTDATSGTPYGTLYNYCAASGNDPRACVDSMGSQLDPSYDICPKGWRLPTGGSSGEFQALYSNASYNTNAKMRAPIASGGAAFALAGYFLGDSPTNQGSTGHYWSSTRRDDTAMYNLSLDTSGVYPTDYYYSGRGLSIRCILK